MIKRVLVTLAAEEVIAQLKARCGDLMFHQSGGYCDGSSPMCFEKGDFKTGGSDVKIVSIAGCEFFMAKRLFPWDNPTVLSHFNAFITLLTFFSPHFPR